MFLDASAIIAILGDEKDAGYLIAKIEACAHPIYYSSLSVFEAAMGFARKKTIEGHGDEVPTPSHLIEQSQKLLESFLRTVEAKELAIADRLYRRAIDASQKFGKAVAHPAGLNFGDCFAYACAKEHKLPLLFIGNDFPQTDIEPA